MKKMKKIMAMIMAMAMVLGMSLTTFAEGEPIIKVSGLPTDVQTTLTYVQIVEPDPSSEIGWKYVDTLTGDGVTKVDGKVTALGGVTIQQLIRDNADVFAQNGTINSNVSIKDVADAVTISTDHPVTTVAKTEGEGENAKTTYASTAELTVTTPGLYVVAAGAEGWTFIRMLAYVPYNNVNGVATTASETILTAKGAKDQIKKVADENAQSVREGDTVSYTITTQYPFYPAGATATKFEIEDSVQNATYDQDTLVVKVGNEVLSKGTDYTVNWTSDAANAKETFKIEFSYAIDKAGKSVEITYDVTVGNLSNGNQLKNTVTQTTENKKTESSYESNSVTFEVTKTDAASTEQNPILLDGAVFTLYEVAEDGTEILNGTINANVVMTTEVGEDGSATQVPLTVTTVDGKGTFVGLDANKTYYVKETTAPTGYSLNETAYLLSGAELDSSKTKVEESGTRIEKDNEGNSIEVTTVTTKYVYTNFNGQNVTDSKLSALPSTGGIGTTIFTIGGVAIMVVAAGLFFVTRKKASK